MYVCTHIHTHIHTHTHHSLLVVFQVLLDRLFPGSLARENMPLLVLFFLLSLAFPGCCLLQLGEGYMRQKENPRNSPTCQSSCPEVPCQVLFLSTFRSLVFVLYLISEVFYLYLVGEIGISIIIHLTLSSQKWKFLAVLFLT